MPTRAIAICESHGYACTTITILLSSTQIANIHASTNINHPSHRHSHVPGHPPHPVGARRNLGSGANRGVALALRVGSGQATYHRYDPTQKQHLITYGARMIAAKHQPETAQGWLSTREIRSRGYFGGEVSVLNLLAHTCCHEFAHLLQHSAGQRHYGSVHNRHFYEALDELHTSGAAHATRQYLSEQAALAGIELSGSAFELPAPMQARQQWQVGDAVRFGDGRSEKKAKSFG